MDSEKSNAFEETFILNYCLAGFIRHANRQVFCFNEIKSSFHVRMQLYRQEYDGVQFKNLSYFCECHFQVFRNKQETMVTFIGMCLWLSSGKRISPHECLFVLFFQYNDKTNLIRLWSPV